MKQCPFCTKNIQDAAIVCKHCGRDLVRKNSSSSLFWWRAYAWGVISETGSFIPGPGLCQPKIVFAAPSRPKDFRA